MGFVAMQPQLVCAIHCLTATQVATAPHDMAPAMGHAASTSGRPTPPGRSCHHQINLVGSHAGSVAMGLPSAGATFVLCAEFIHLEGFPGDASAPATVFDVEIPPPRA